MKKFQEYFYPVLSLSILLFFGLFFPKPAHAMRRRPASPIPGTACSVPSPNIATLLDQEGLPIENSNSTSSFSDFSIHQGETESASESEEKPIVETLSQEKLEKSDKPTADPTLYVGRNSLLKGSCSSDLSNPLSDAPQVAISVSDASNFPSTTPSNREFLQNPEDPSQQKNPQEQLKLEGPDKKSTNLNKKPPQVPKTSLGVGGNLPYSGQKRLPGGLGGSRSTPRQVGLPHQTSSPGSSNLPSGSSLERRENQQLRTTPILEARRDKGKQRKRGPEPTPVSVPGPIVRCPVAKPENVSKSVPDNWDESLTNAEIQAEYGKHIPYNQETSQPEDSRDPSKNYVTKTDKLLLLTDPKELESFLQMTNSFNPYDDALWKRTDVVNIHATSIVNHDDCGFYHATKANNSYFMRSVPDQIFHDSPFGRFLVDEKYITLKEGIPKKGTSGKIWKINKSFTVLSTNGTLQNIPEGAYIYFDYKHGNSFEVFFGDEKVKKCLCEVYVQGFANWKKSFKERTLTLP